MPKQKQQRRQRQPKSREMANGIMAGVRELQGYLDQGMNQDQIVEHIRRQHPERVRTVFIPPKPAEYPPAAVKRLRASMGMSQSSFAQTLGVSTILVQGWEQGVREPSPLARRLLDTISADPAAWLDGLTRGRRAG
jgi:DNA-binding transcriptional regulator YiaG